MNICLYCNEWHNENIACSAMSAGVNRVKKDLTKRELFAAMAMQGMLAANTSLFGKSCDELAKYAATQADVLIAELDKESEK